MSLILLVVRAIYVCRKELVPLICNKSKAKTRKNRCGGSRDRSCGTIRREGVVPPFDVAQGELLRRNGERMRHPRSGWFQPKVGRNIQTR